jgi:tryptophan-rich sensory protein
MTVAILVVAASVGTELAGADSFATLASFPQPWFALAPWAWVTVGVLYYAAMAVILYRLLRRSPSSRRALRLVVAIVLANEVWNALVFGLRAPWAASVGLVAFAALVAGTIQPARRQDPVSGWILLGYLVWLVGYDLPWIFIIAVRAAA